MKRELTIPRPLAFAFFRVMCWWLVARCWVRGGDHQGLRRALDQQIEIARRFGVHR